MKIGKIDWDDIEEEKFENLENDNFDELLFEDYDFLNDELDQPLQDYLESIGVDSYNENE